MRQLQALARDRFFVLVLILRHAALVSEAIHFHAALSVHAHQDVVVLALNAVLADHIALMEAGELRQC